MFLFPQEVAASAWQVLHNAHICNVTGVFKVTPCNNTRKYRTSNTLKTLTQYLFIAFALLHADIDVCFSSLHFCTQTFIPAAFILLLIFHTWAGFHRSFRLIQSSLPSIRLDACKNKQCLGTNNEHMLSVKTTGLIESGRKRCCEVDSEQVWGRAEAKISLLYVCSPDNNNPKGNSECANQILG